MCKAIRILQGFLQTSGNNGVGTVLGVVLSLFIMTAPSANATALDSSDSFVSPFGYVTDLAQLVEPEVERKICDIATELERKTGIRIAVISVPELYGYDIEDFTHELLNQWFQNPIVRAHSVLIIDAPNDKKLRLEMGVALDTILTTEASRRIREQVLLPALQKGNKGQAYLLTITELAAAIADHQNVTLYQLLGPGFLKNQPATAALPRNPGRDTSSSLWFLPIIMAALWIGYRETRSAALLSKNKTTTPSE